MVLASRFMKGIFSRVFDVLDYDFIRFTGLVWG
jgi:hypothetical protein